MSIRRSFSLLISSLILAGATQAAEESPAELYAVLPGFKIEHVLKADPKLNGSWISMAKDPQGRLLLGGQNNQPVTRVTLKDGKVEKQENIQLAVSETMGMVFVGDTLYVSGAGKGPGGARVNGLFRCKDAAGAGRYDSVEFLREWKGGNGEHGAHGIVLGPDNHLYLVNGNFTAVPGDLLPSSPHRNYEDDQVLKRAEDGKGFGIGKKPPGGYILRLDLDGKNPELFASGQRNTYDVAFNADGELFGFDSDMEYDWGMPWYRPIRVFQAVSGGESGFREGSAKWPEYYADSIPASVNIGIGCPTGVVFGTGAKFPITYQKAFYILDWTYGRLIAVHLKPDGAGYTGTWENFVAPKELGGSGRKSPLNLTDAVIGDDGAMYFTVGGRDTRANLYRLSYGGPEPSAPLPASDLRNKEGESARALRHQLEALHGKADPGTVETIWPHLNNPDRYIRYAARIALERNPIEQWKAKALAESQPAAALTALLALARLDKTSLPDIARALEKFPFGKQSAAQQMETVRILQVAIARQGAPTTDVAKTIADGLSPSYPSPSANLNLELCQLLLAIEAPDAVAKTMALLSTAGTQEEQAGFVMHLRHARRGWTPELRRQYFSWFTTDMNAKPHPAYVTKWFEEAGRPFANGASYPYFIGGFYTEARNTLDAAEITALSTVLNAYVPPELKQPRKTTKVRKFVKEWTSADLLPALEELGKGRDFARGKEVYESAQCIACHKFGNDGGAVGPDLTAIAARYKRQDMLESITEPSKVLSEQYMNTAIKTNDGSTVAGRVTEETDEKLVLQPDPLKPEKITLKKTDIKVRALSKISPMPEGSLNNFTKEEILDLLAYIESGGNKDHPNFRK